MRFWQRGRHDLRASPLSPGVPLEGSETVIGLRQLDLHYRTQSLRSRLESISTNLSCPSDKSKCASFTAKYVLHPFYG